jgi:hypothetical protein
MPCSHLPNPLALPPQWFLTSPGSDTDNQVVMATGPMFANIQWGTYALFAALNGLVIFPSVYFFFPETKKYSLEDVSHSTSLPHLLRTALPSTSCPSHSPLSGPGPLVKPSSLRSQRSTHNALPTTLYSLRSQS